MEGTKHPSIFLPKLYSRIYGLHLLSVLGEWNMLHNLHFVDFHEFVSASKQPSCLVLPWACYVPLWNKPYGRAQWCLSFPIAAPSELHQIPPWEGSPRGFCLILRACRALGSGLYWQNHSGMRCRKPKSNYCYENILFTVKEKRKLNFLRAFSFFYLFPAEFSSCCFTLSALTNVFRDY